VAEVATWNRADPSDAQGAKAQKSKPLFLRIIFAKSEAGFSITWPHSFLEVKMVK